MEWIRRACEEKLEREKKEREVSESAVAYLSQDAFNAFLKAALRSPEIQQIICTITK